MFITPSFKKSLIVEQFQGNYLKALSLSGDRAADLAFGKTQEILRFPDNSGFLFFHLWSKTLAKVIRMFLP